ncbi:MAG TPA: carboxypeptidase-like regulatory domain-containing protein, partial [Terriglobia bacterium]|nr:carboxypeptidase-like regulatory domain-containing protein [Terriglobia bacterium]
MRKLTSFICFEILAVLLACTSASAQSNYAVLGGTVLDPQTNVVPNVDVQMTAKTTGAVRHATTNEFGIFQFTGLLPGEYEFSIVAAGFAAYSRTVQMEVGQQVRLEANLKLATVVGNVSVLSESEEVLQTTDASVGEVIEET